MAFNIFKRKKQEPQQGEPAGALAKEKEQTIPAVVKKTKKKGGGLAPFVLLRPHITEKAGWLQKRGQYVFQVKKSATKQAVRDAVEGLYGVLVESVSIQKKPGKTRRVKRQIGRKPGFKKAVVTLKPGEKIEIVSR